MSKEKIEAIDSIFELKNGKSWRIVHNLSTEGILAAYENYIVRAKKPSEDGFIKYILSKGLEGIFAFPYRKLA